MFFDLFDRIYIINLPHRTDRRREMWEQLRRVGLKKDDQKIVFFPAVRPEEKGAFPTLGARGCFLSHLQVLEKIKEEGISSALILEDDCNFSSTIFSSGSILESILKNGDWDIFYGGALNYRSTPMPVAGVVEIVLPEMGLMGSHCIAVSRVAAGDIAEYFKRMLSRSAGDSNGGPMHVDGAYSWYRSSHPDCKTLLAVPEIVYQRASATDVHENRRWDDSMIFKWPIAIFRKIKNKIRQKIDL